MVYKLGLVHPHTHTTHKNYINVFLSSFVGADGGGKGTVLVEGEGVIVDGSVSFYFL